MASTPLETLSFRLALLGAAHEASLAARLAALDLKPKHVALLSLLRSRGAESQVELAAALGVAPSLVVLLADRLAERGAIQRVRDPADRRRQSLRLTAEGARLLDAATAEAATLDDTLGLSADDRAALDRILDSLLEQ
ncbi:MarR family winged helix-turn-helix transcriptional regulator [Paractinoplanes lichenicola]|uniref:MarR family transcriptional regulator n=1 Tax=Paractinoplanes lichenicola TaxID=2802976 RepID=A0ABS1VY72_9ACTN|nr:MarR family transcriptional regulator [Actinoplanes lichenicola]MBL7259446.1 MarR family transcriptional regulator [Actinoplanes lichenicola]